MTDPVLEALWKKVLDDFASEEAHGRFLEHCRATQQLLEAAVRYRGMAGDHTRGPLAEKRLQGIVILALSELETQRTAPLERSGLRVALVLLFLCASSALMFALMR